MINIAQIGVGYWGPNLLRNFSLNKDCTVKTVVELSSERKKFVNNLYPLVHVTSDVESVFNDSDIDALLLPHPLFHTMILL